MIFFKILLIVIAGLITGFLGALGGARDYSKSIRRFGIPILLSLLALLFVKNLWVITIFLMIAPFSLGYGIPSPEGDKGSTVGRFFFNLCKQNYRWADILTRGTIALLTSATLIIIPILKGNWALYWAAALTIFAIDVLFGGNAIIKGEGVFKIKLFGKEIELGVEETIRYGVVGLMSAMVIVI